MSIPTGQTLLDMCSRATPTVLDSHMVRDTTPEPRIDSPGGLQVHHQSHNVQGSSPRLVLLRRLSVTGVQGMKSNGLPMVSLLGHIRRVLKRQLLQMQLMVLVLKILTKSRSTTFETPHIPLP
jgi:hypothetical protein